MLSPHSSARHVVPHSSARHVVPHSSARHVVPHGTCGVAWPGAGGLAVFSQ